MIASNISAEIISDSSDNDCTLPKASTSKSSSSSSSISPIESSRSTARNLNINHIISPEPKRREIPPVNLNSQFINTALQTVLFNSTTSVKPKQAKKKVVGKSGACITSAEAVEILNEVETNKQLKIVSALENKQIKLEKMKQATIDAELKKRVKSEMKEKKKD